MHFKYLDWELKFELKPSQICMIAVESPTILYNYVQMLSQQSEGKDGKFALFKDLKELSIEKCCTIEFNLSGFVINSKKLQTALIKKCTSVANGPEFERELQELSQGLFTFTSNVALDTGYSVVLEQDIDVAGIFKLYDLKLKENHTSFLFKLIEYVNVNVEFLKTNIFIFLFLTKFLSKQDLQLFFSHCSSNDISLVIIEERLDDDLKQFNIPLEAIIIDRDNFELYYKS
ncbi:MAG: type II-A CRISPR-associated protein Csn2 [Clostridiales bacterium]|jgi:CRISPR type II-A-associated protein Csn2|nr:type II-A CRISPR-associated protein Csn2 [Clostridiales bacterium]